MADKEPRQPTHRAYSVIPTSSPTNSVRSIAAGICAVCCIPAAVLWIVELIPPAAAVLLVLFPVAGAVGIAALPEDLA